MKNVPSQSVPSSSAPTRKYRVEPDKNNPNRFRIFSSESGEKLSDFTVTGSKHRRSRSISLPENLDVLRHSSAAEVYITQHLSPSTIKNLDEFNDGKLMKLLNAAISTIYASETGEKQLSHLVNAKKFLMRIEIEIRKLVAPTTLATSSRITSEALSPLNNLVCEICSRVHSVIINQYYSREGTSHASSFSDASSILALDKVDIEKPSSSTTDPLLKRK